MGLPSPCPLPKGEVPEGIFKIASPFFGGACKGKGVFLCGLTAMALLLGIDTGGTYTDAVLFNEAQGEPVRAKAKSLTTRDDLSQGIAGAIGAVIAQSGVDPAEIALVSISTTLATNALVEGVRRRVCLIYVGFEEADLGRSGLREALGTDPVLLIAGGYKATGEERAPLDLEELRAKIEAVRDSVEAFAVTAIFGSRNPAHEIAIRELIHSLCDAPVTCGHELSAELDGPRNALTCVLNARLIGTIAALIASTEQSMAELGVDAPLMIVRGDGSLVSAAFARARPIETILSGPAASLVGAAHLTGLQDAVISDIGGTTTDIAVLRDGRPLLSKTGATVGGNRTMIEAVEMTTHGLGGDSEINLDEQAFKAGLILGPRKLVPVSLFALDHAALVADSLATQMRVTRAGEYDAQFVEPTAASKTLPDGLRKVDLSVLERIGGTPQPLDKLGLSRAEVRALRHLVSLGLLRLVGFTPSDAAHVLGLHTEWDTQVARDAATLYARKKDRRGAMIAETPEALARMVIDTLTRRSAEVILQTTFEYDGLGKVDAAGSALVQAAFAQSATASRINIGVALPIIGLGASAPTYYPAIAAKLGAECVVPDHAGVANAVGAVAGRVSIEKSLLISAPREGVYRVHTASESKDFGEKDAALAHARATLEADTTTEAREAGAENIELTVTYEEKAPMVEGREMFIEGVLTARATGRPKIESRDDRAT